MNKGKLLPILFIGAMLIIIGIWCASGVTYATEGTRIAALKWGKIERIISPDDGFVLLLSPGWDKYEINVKSFTGKATAKVTSKDNAALQVEVAVTGATDGSSEAVASYLRAFGMSEEERHKRRDEILGGIIQTEARNAFSEYAAYDIYANQEAIQKKLYDSVKSQVEKQLFVRVDSVQLGNPDFLDDRIEQAASAVVANQKAKEASQAAYEAAKIDNERKLLEAQTYANPAAFTIKKMELQLEIERARAEGIRGHQGALYLNYGNGSGPLISSTMEK
jgi:regulator of protease activity HflC (stomatin/prohibitin superfamily)